MKNKGFTLLELLGVIIILAILVTLSFPGVINFIKSSTTKKDKIINDLIISAAESYVVDNSSNLYLTNGIEYCISIDALIGKNYLKNILDDNDSYKEKVIRLTYDSKINYEMVDNDKCSVCKLVSGNYNQLGSKYQCKVKDVMEIGFEDGYYFYLLSKNNDETINLIMDQNINYDGTPAGKVGIDKTLSQTNYNLVEWVSALDYGCSESNCAKNNKGPITAIKFLYNATKNWTNISPINYMYNDKELQETTIEDTSYTSFISNNGIATITSLFGDTVIIGDEKEPLRARLPVYISDSKQTEIEEKTDYNSYLYDNLDSSIDNASNGYWTISSSSANNYDAWAVYANYFVIDDSVFFDSNYGVRPVITVENRFILD